MVQGKAWFVAKMPRKADEHGEAQRTQAKATEGETIALTQELDRLHVKEPNKNGLVGDQNGKSNGQVVENDKKTERKRKRKKKEGQPREGPISESKEQIAQRALKHVRKIVALQRTDLCENVVIEFYNTNKYGEPLPPNYYESILDSSDFDLDRLGLVPDWFEGKIAPVTKEELDIMSTREIPPRQRFKKKKNEQQTQHQQQQQQHQQKQQQQQQQNTNSIDRNPIRQQNQRVQNHKQKSLQRERSKKSNHDSALSTS